MCDEPARLLFEANLDLIRDLARGVARWRRLRREEAEEFTSYVWLRLMEDEYRILRSFQGRSSLRTFLVTVLHRLLLDFRVQTWGKWRPSAAIRRLGPEAVELERLISRDGHSPESAAELLGGLPGGPARDELRALAGRIPKRVRPRPEGETALYELPSRESTDERVLEGERRTLLRRLRGHLADALRALPDEDRQLLRMRYAQGMTVRKIASTLEVEDRRMYRRLERCLAKLRATLERQGVSPC